MNQTPCPMCGKNSLTENRGEYRFEPPDPIPGGAIVVPDATWYECGACHEQIVPPALEQAIERERCRRLGLLTPEEIKACANARASALSIWPRCSESVRKPTRDGRTAVRFRTSPTTH